MRWLQRGEALLENTNSLASHAFIIGLTYGLQRSYGKIHFLFDFGPVYYFDLEDNNGWYPIMIQLNFGLNLHKK